MRQALQRIAPVGHIALLCYAKDQASKGFLIQAQFITAYISEKNNLFRGSPPTN
jgi:hypothetical protein